MKHVELEQFLHAFTSRGFDSVSWAFLFYFLLFSMCHYAVNWCYKLRFLPLFTYHLTASSCTNLQLLQRAGIRLTH